MRNSRKCHASAGERFSRVAAAAVAAAALTTSGAGPEPLGQQSRAVRPTEPVGNRSNPVRVAVMGVNGRGKQLLRVVGRVSASRDHARLRPRFDCDSARPIKVASKGDRKPPAPSATSARSSTIPSSTCSSARAPDHWHALATVLACQAGKDVYVEKPVSHNIVEGRRMVEAARKYNRIVQAGTQRRSSEELALGD